jgi:hypothetical protein
MSHGNEMICQLVTLSGYAEWPKVADAVIEAPLPYVINCLCIGFGVWGFAAYLFPGEVPKAPLNLFWHLGLLAYGFHLL